MSIPNAVLLVGATALVTMLATFWFSGFLISANKEFFDAVVKVSEVACIIVGIVAIIITIMMIITGKIAI